MDIVTSQEDEGRRVVVVVYVSVCVYARVRVCVRACMYDLSDVHSILCVVVFYAVTIKRSC